MRPVHPVRHVASILCTAWLLGGAGVLAAGSRGEVHELHRLHELEGGCGLECLHGKLEMLGGGAFDAASGANHRNYPPDRRVDHLHMKLLLRFDDLDARRFSAVEELSVRGVADGTATLPLDAVGLAISSVDRDGRPATFYADGQRVTVTFDPPLAAGEEATLRFVYECSEPPRGMIFTPSDPAAPQRGPELHTQGQPEQNRHWFVGHDSPNERLTTELVVDVPAGFVASGNGKLVDQREEGGRSIWHWVQDRPHVNYLVSLVVGRFERVPIAPGSRGVPMTVWVPPGRAGDVERTFGRTGRMVDLFEARFGVPYPWHRYDQLVVRNFGAGGMENTSATTLQPFALLDEAALLDGDIDGLIAHELGHQWFGDLITCRSWAHIWLNEGWATYASALWNEERFGHEGYLDSILGNFAVAQRDRTENPVGMVSNEWSSPGETFGRAANPYSKGASILHMLRRMLGEEVFWAGVHTYVRRHQNTVVETDDFRHALEEVSGRDLQWFFDQWCVRPGTPRLDVAASYDPDRGEVVVTVAQTQTIDARTPAFRFDLPVLVRTPSGDVLHTIPVSTRTASATIGVPQPPTMIVVDPELHVLKTIDLDLPLPLLLAQAERGPNVAARRMALSELSGDDRPEVRELLARIVQDQARRHTERAQALDLLAGLGSPAARERVLAILDAGIDEARVRERALRHVGEHDRAVAMPRLLAAARQDPSYDCRALAIERIAAIEAKADPATRDPAVVELALSLLSTPSHAEKIRLAAIEGLATLEDARGLDAAIEASRFGMPDRVRPRAIGLVGRFGRDLGDDARTKAIAALLPLLDDPERRSLLAAGSALADLKATEARLRIAALADSGPDWARDAAKGWLSQIDGKAGDKVDGKG